MSVVACRVYDDRIEIASDSITVRGWTQSKSKNGHSKLVEVNNMFLGAVGSCEESSMFQIFCKTRKPFEASEASILTFTSEFASWKKEQSGVWGIDNNYILVCDGKAFCIEGFYVEEILTFTAIGAGMDFALAALQLDYCVFKAVEVACELSAMCELPVKPLYMKV